MLGSTIYVYTDHKTLLNFDGQKDLSWRQLQWQEYMSQYELCMHYIQGEDNMVADALSWLPPDSIGAVCALAPHVVWASGVKVTMSLSTDGSVLQAIKDGYKSDLSVIDYQRQAHLKLNVSGPATVRLHWSVEYITSCLQ